MKTGCDSVKFAVDVSFAHNAAPKKQKNKVRYSVRKKKTKCKAIPRGVFDSIRNIRLSEATSSYLGAYKC